MRYDKEVRIFIIMFYRTIRMDMCSKININNKEDLVIDIIMLIIMRLKIMNRKIMRSLIS
jgi:hypothetical protein